MAGIPSAVSGAGSLVGAPHSRHARHMSTDQPIGKGHPAPEVTLQLHDGSSVALASLRGELVLLWFYPQDDTPG